MDLADQSRRRSGSLPEIWFSNWTAEKHRRRNSVCSFRREKIGNIETNYEDHLVFLREKDLSEVLLTCFPGKPRKTH